jgi:hypothetical protein
MSIEDKLSLFDIQIEGIPIWERVRYETYYELKRGSIESNTVHDNGKKFNLEIPKKYKRTIQGIGLWIKNLLIKNPYLSTECEYLFWGHQRRKLHDSLWWDIYCDPIYEELDLDVLHLEVAHKGDNVSHLTPAKTENIKYLDLHVFTGTIIRELLSERYPIKSSKIDEIRSAEEKINSEFDESVDLEQIIKNKLAERKGRKILYDILLKKLDPKLVILVVSVFRATFIESCKKHNIPTIELQHGGFGPDHPGYSFPGDKEKKTFPDYLFTFGEFWADRVEFPISDNNIYSVGYPYLQWQKERYDEIKHEKSILFISQGPLGKTVTKFASEYAEIEDEYEIIVKLHPDESDGWEIKYPWLTTAPLTVIDKNQPPLYKLLASSTVQVGVTSTVLYEGLTFNLETYLIDDFRPMRTDHLVSDGLAKFVGGPEDLFNTLRTEWSPEKIDSRYYFEENPCINIKNAIDDILRRESLQ